MFSLVHLQLQSRLDADIAMELLRVEQETVRLENSYTILSDEQQKARIVFECNAIIIANVPFHRPSCCVSRCLA
jgi:hypothetical protein